jgi:hypothetical protein
MPSGPKQDLQADFSKHKQKKTVAAGQVKNKYSARLCKDCAAHKKHSDTKFICKFCVV